MEGKGGEKSIKHMNYFPQHEFTPHKDLSLPNFLPEDKNKHNKIGI